MQNAEEIAMDGVEEQNASEEVSFALIATNIIWGNEVQPKSKIVRKDRSTQEYPAQFIIDLPRNLIVQAKKSDSFDDVVETFIYNFLTHKFGREVNRCQIWYQFDEDALESV